MADLNVATTIVMQLGGFKFMSMTGARDFVGGPDSVMFRIPSARRINKVRVTLTPMDTYRVEFFRIARRGCNFQLVSSADDVYADSLQDVFSHHTGLDTHL